MTDMRKTVIKKLKKLTVKSGVLDAPSKPKSTGLKKSDPDYYRKIGQISAARRQMSSEEFSAMAKKSHLTRPKSSYKGGRPKKVQLDA